MKLRIGILIALIVGVQTVSLAQKDSISKYFSSFEYDRDNTVVTISGRMFKIFGNFEVDDEEDQEIIDMMSKLTGLKIVTNSDVRDGFAVYREAMEGLPDREFEELLKIRDDEKDMTFLIKEDNDIISELLMLSGSDHEFIIMSIVGEINLEQIAQLSDRMDIDGLEELENIKDN